MASLYRTGSTRRKAEAPGNIRIQFKQKRSTKASNDFKASRVEDSDDEQGSSDDGPVAFEAGSVHSETEAQPKKKHGTAAVQSESSEEAQSKKKRDVLVRIDTSILDNVSCTSCGHQLNPYKGGAVQKHSELLVVICKHCEKFLASGEISKDSDGADEQCRWCGEGGRLLVCDECSGAFCKSCVLRNFSRSEFNNINSQDNWRCYLCNPAPLKGLRENYRKLKDTLKALKEKKNSTPLPTKKTEPSSATKSQVASSQQNLAESVSREASSSSILSITSDVNVKPENAVVITDKLITATNTFIGVLQALQSSPSVVIDQQRKQQQAKALNKILQQYLKSIKSILTEPCITHEVKIHLAKLPEKKSGEVASLSVKKAHPPSRVSSKSTISEDGDFTKKSNSSRKTDESIQNSSSDESKNNLSDEINKTNEHIPNTKKINGHLSLENSTTSKSKEKIVESSADSDSDNDVPSSTKDQSNASKTEKTKVLSRSKNSITNSTDSSDLNSKGKKTKSSGKSSSEAKEIHEESDGDDISGKDNFLNDNSEGETELATNIEESDHNTSLTKTNSEPISEIIDHDKVHSEIDNNLHSPDKNLQETSTVSLTSDSHEDENLAAKFDIIRELADEMLRDNSDEDDCDLPISFGQVTGEPEEDSEKTTPTKKSIALTNSVKKSDSLSSTKSSQPLSSANGKQSKVDKQEKHSDASEVSDSSSSDPLMSDDGGQLKAKRRKRNKTDKNGSAKSKSIKTSSEKTNAEKTKTGVKKPAAKTSSSDDEEIDKEIKKLSKLPTRKRKAVDMSEDEDVTKEDEPVSSSANKTVKRAKAGPKCSKKGIDYDDLSSDDNEQKFDDEDIDEEEEELPIVFDTTGLKDAVIDENELAKNRLLEDIESSNNEEDNSSSDESTDVEKDAEKKTKKKESEKDDEKDTVQEKDDSDEDIGKRKKTYNKLLDAKLSDSDSDIGKPKKKKKDSDDESFKADKSPESSSISDLSSSSDDDDDESDSSDEDDSDSKSNKKGKKKAKGKKKGRKGKKKSDGSDDDDSEEGSGKKKKGKAKKRKRIKTLDNSSDENEEESDNDDNNDANTSKGGKRKEIRKVMSKKKLEDSTKAAAKAEEKRRKRIAVKQREFNIETMTDENNPLIGVVTTKLVLEAGKEEDDSPVIEVNKKLVRKLKPHQVEAVQFLWDCLYESVKRAKKQEGAGCILAHCMGLGKTLSVVAFVHTVLSHKKILKHRTCLVVTPLNTVLNWKNEWTMWLDEEDQFEVWELASCKQNVARVKALKEWQENGGIMIIGYEMYRNLTTGNRCKNKKQKAAFQETLVDPGPDLVICDEGHILKNEASAISKAMNQMKTMRRVVLTGTPLQNNLSEYHCMVSFVKPNLLGTKKEFTNRFISPIQNGQCTDSTQKDVGLMKARAHVLHEMLAGCVQVKECSR